MDEQMPVRPAWGLWQLNPRFYRRPLRPPVYQELYWIFGFEIVATIALGLTIYYLSIAPGLERRRMQMEIYFKMRDRPTPARSGGESPLR
ncbi:MAG: hypothetical protein EBS30_06415 [Planctomycetes bacterium]|jgi:hypothetical protein|nr:hypothetical protein [Planctomycetota bacterium]